MKEQPRPTEVQHSKPALVETKEPVQTKQLGRTLKGIRVTKANNSTTVFIVGDGAIINYKAFKLDQPARFVIDLLGVEKTYSLKSILVKSGEIKQMRIG
jgi:hypothetical protein